ncbi:hypothetical protein [Rhizobium leguminosarum]|uniref:hypothetical protein n=1 Tax=Rhizobium leguminosarum TaxID=384 RepID=UPI00144145DA|nr:hypothetical protein [Rhizobium leguminosarum]MBY5863244.1 hypothetical protein [Rhizobium leguminosarum]
MMKLLDSWFGRRVERAVHGLSGDGSLIEIRMPFGWYVYARRRVQKWSPILHEVEVEQGYRFGSRRIGVTRSFLIWHDKTPPAIEKKRYGL